MCELKAMKLSEDLGFVAVCCVRRRRCALKYRGTPEPGPGPEPASWCTVREIFDCRLVASSRWVRQ